MRLRWLYAVAGGAWGVVLGAVAAISAFGIAAGIAWLYLYGETIRGPPLRLGRCRY